MTICIAALADQGKSAILACDKMLTMPGLSYQIEKEYYNKKYCLNGDYVMFSGDAIAAYEVIENAKKIIADNEKKNISPLSDIKETLRQAYQSYRRKLVIQRFLETRGLTLDLYYSGKINIPPQVVMEIENAFQNININLEMIIVSKGCDELFHIFQLQHPGEVKCFDPIGYACIGCGTIHSLYFLTGSDYSISKSKEDIKKLVQEAKQKAEKSPGVGTQTDLIELPK